MDYFKDLMEHFVHPDNEVMNKLYNHKPKLKMEKKCITLVDENGIELLVGYDREESGSQVEEGHGLHEVGELVYRELTSVEVVIRGIGIDILPMMEEKQKESIVSLINELEEN